MPRAEAAEPFRLVASPGAPPLQGRLRWRLSPRARRVSLRIDPRSGEVVVTLPPRASRRAGMALLQANAGWVAAQLAALAPALTLGPGTSVPLAGEPHRIEHDPAGRAGVQLQPGLLVAGGPASAVPAMVLGLLRREARRRIATHAARHAARLGVTLRGIALKDTRSRWGSCTAEGRLAFSWRLVMAPDWVLSHVVAHEVAHRREMNHSPAFWAVLAGLDPNRAPAEAWLRRHGPALLRVGTGEA